MTVIATHGRGELLERTLASLAAATLPERYAGTLVVENGPPAGARDVVAAAPAALRATYLHVERANKSAALNAALATIDDDVLLVFTDDDVRVEEGVLLAYARASEGLRGGVYFGGPVEAEHEVPPPPHHLLLLPPSARGWPLAHERPVTGHRFVGFNWAAFAGDLKRAGGFDPRFGPGSSTGSTGQESNMQDRLFAMGVKPQYLPQARVWHWVPKERCSPNWILQRGYRYGVQCGLEGYAHDRKRFPPRLALRFSKWTALYAASYALRYEKLGFEARVHVNELLGELRGRWTSAGSTAARK